MLSSDAVQSWPLVLLRMIDKRRRDLQCQNAVAHRFESLASTMGVIAHAKRRRVDVSWQECWRKKSRRRRKEGFEMQCCGPEFESAHDSLIRLSFVGQTLQG